MACKVFTIANQKGGVGKTTTAVNLAAGLADSGIETLLIDLEGETSSSTMVTCCSGQSTGMGAVPTMPVQFPELAVTMIPACHRWVRASPNCDPPDSTSLNWADAIDTRPTVQTRQPSKIR